jgi:DNA-binding transcriptional LysR family regulator
MDQRADSMCAHSKLSTMNEKMEIRHLQTFVIAAESQSFTRTAESLGLTQAAVSQHIASIEKDLNAALFDRGPRSVMLTETGRRVYEQARRILDLVDAIYQDAGKPETEIGGIIRIACSSVPSEWLLPEILLRFRREYPKIQEFVSVSDSASAIKSVETGTAEIGVVGELPRSTNLHTRAIAQDELILVVAPTHPFAVREKIQPHELCGQSMIVREAGSGSRRCAEEALSRAGLSLTDVRISMEVNSNDAIQAAIERGIGVSFLSRRAKKRELTEKRLIAVEIDGFAAVRDLYVVTDPKRLPTRVARAFLELVDGIQFTDFSTC